MQTISIIITRLAWLFRLHPRMRLAMLPGRAYAIKATRENAGPISSLDSAEAWRLHFSSFEALRTMSNIYLIEVDRTWLNQHRL